MIFSIRNILRDRKRELEQVASAGKVDANPRESQKQLLVTQSISIQQMPKPVLVESGKHLHRVSVPGIFGEKFYAKLMHI